MVAIGVTLLILAVLPAYAFSIYGVYLATRATNALVSLCEKELKSNLYGSSLPLDTRFEIMKEDEFAKLKEILKKKKSDGEIVNPPGQYI